VDGPFLYNPRLCKRRTRSLSLSFFPSLGRKLPWHFPEGLPTRPAFTAQAYSQTNIVGGRPRPFPCNLLRVDIGFPLLLPHRLLSDFNLSANKRFPFFFPWVTILRLSLEPQNPLAPLTTFRWSQLSVPLLLAPWIAGLWLFFFLQD